MCNLHITIAISIYFGPSWTQAQLCHKVQQHSWRPVVACTRKKTWWAPSAHWSAKKGKMWGNHHSQWTEKKHLGEKINEVPGWCVRWLKKVEKSQLIKKQAKMYCSLPGLKWRWRVTELEIRLHWVGFSIEDACRKECAWRLMGEEG